MTSRPTAILIAGLGLCPSTWRQLLLVVQPNGEHGQLLFDAGGLIWLRTRQATRNANEWAWLRLVPSKV